MLTTPLQIECPTIATLAVQPTLTAADGAISTMVDCTETNHSTKRHISSCFAAPPHKLGWPASFSNWLQCAPLVARPDHDPTPTDWASHFLNEKVEVSFAWRKWRQTLCAQKSGRWNDLRLNRGWSPTTPPTKSSCGRAGTVSSPDN